MVLTNQSVSWACLAFIDITDQYIPRYSIISFWSCGSLLAIAYLRNFLQDDIRSFADPGIFDKSLWAFNFYR